MPPPPAPDANANAKRILLPALAVAGVAVLIGAVLAIGDGAKPASTSGSGNGKSKMAGRFDFPLDGPEWKTLDGGLKVWDVAEGSGEACTAKNKVTAFYSGWTANGTKFDSSLDKGEPIAFSLTRVIPGWTQGIPGMKVGSVRRLFIPAALGYADSPPHGSKIPPNADLVFEVELTAIQ